MGLLHKPIWEVDQLNSESLCHDEHADFQPKCWHVPHSCSHMTSQNVVHRAWLVDHTVKTRLNINNYIALKKTHFNLF